MTLIETVSAGYAACGVSAGSRIGIALSGGADSVALLAASVRLGFEVVPLHCNFHLRGAESDRDERFVRSLCARLGLADRLHLTDFDVDAQMRATGESVEMACRTLRYRWFEERAGALGLTAVAVGHHADDDAETFVLNLMRGTGLRGLAGMPRSRDLFVRPMIGCTRAEVLDFLSAEGLDYVTDSTNLADEYMRNRVRHAVLPAMELANPNAHRGVASTIRNLRSDLALLDALVARRAEALTKPDGSIDLDALSEDGKMAPDLLFQILRQRGAAGVTHRMAEEIVAARGHSGASFRLGESMLLAIDRGRLHFVGPPLREDDDSVAVFSLAELVGGEVRCLLPLSAELVPASEFRPDRTARTLWLSERILESGKEMTLRRWRRGDRMVPFGMRGSRLLSDIFSDARIPVHEKRRLWVLEHGGVILWVPGLRASAHFAVTSADRQVIRMTMVSKIV